MSKANPRYADWRARDRLRKELEADRSPCWMCGLPIPTGVGHRHPYAMEVDEVVPVSKGGGPTDRANVRRSHRCCNQWRGDKDAADVVRIAAAARAAFGRWTSPAEFVVFARSAPKMRKAHNAAKEIVNSREW